MLELDAQPVLESAERFAALRATARGEAERRRAMATATRLAIEIWVLFAPGPLHPLGDVAGAMQHAPNVDTVRGFDVEHDVREAPDRPRAQPRQVQFH